MVKYIEEIAYLTGPTMTMTNPSSVGLKGDIYITTNLSPTLDTQMERVKEQILKNLNSKLTIGKCK